MTPIIIAENCPYCAKPRSPREIIHGSSFKICQDCYQKHIQALSALGSGKYAGECSECGKSVAELTAMQGRGDNSVGMSVIYEAGIYRIFCSPCATQYERKRREFFAGTQYAKEKGLN